MRITKEQANDISNAAMVEAGFNITQYAGYYEIWRDDEDENVNYAVAINKEQDDNGNDKHFAIYVSAPLTEEGWWEYTDELNVNELSDELMRIAMDIELYEAKQKGVVDCANQEEEK